MWFGIPGVAGTYLGAYLSQGLTGAMQLLLFALIMLAAAYTMWRARDPRPDKTKHHPYWQILLEGLAVGIITGLVGVGSGFLIIPALVLLGGLFMRLAVGTSLLIIAMKSLVGFSEYAQVLSHYHINWNLIALFVSLGIVGSFLSQKLPQLLLRKLFAVVLVVLGIFILYQNIPSILGYALGLETIAITIIFGFTLLLVLTSNRESISVREVPTLQGDSVVIDVREIDEFREGHVAIAKNIPLSQLEQRISEVPRDKKVYVICRSGRRSGLALKTLRQASYKNIRAVRGGMLA
ncbi:MAG: TSUP family transporter [Trueperaceae bacterium]